jgi:hypothetical protein
LANPPDGPTHVSGPQTGPSRRATGLSGQSVEVAQRGRFEDFEDDDVPIGDDDKLSSWLQAEALSNLLGDDDLPLRRQGGGRGVGQSVVRVGSY